MAANTKVTPDHPIAFADGSIRLLLCGDVMLGRGIDQILPRSNDPVLHEQWRDIHDARAFVELAVRQNGPLPEARDATYIWGDVLHEFTDSRADLRLVNLETAVSTSDDHRPDKINYRMHPQNVKALQAARIDCCSLANNHVLDWGYRGLQDTVDTLRATEVRTVGAGCDLREAQTPAVFDIPGRGKIAIFAFAAPSSHVPAEWAARENQPGVSFIDLSEPSVDHISNLVESSWGRVLTFNFVTMEHVTFSAGDAGGAEFLIGRKDAFRNQRLAMFDILRELDAEHGDRRQLPVVLPTSTGPLRTKCSCQRSSRGETKRPCFH